MLRSLLPWEKVVEGRMRGRFARPTLCGAAMGSSPLISPLCGQLLPWEKVAEGRMRGGFALIAPKRVIAESLPLISQRAEPLTASPSGEAYPRVSLRSSLTHLPFGGTGS